MAAIAIREALHDRARVSGPRPPAFRAQGADAGVSTPASTRASTRRPRSLFTHSSADGRGVGLAALMSSINLSLSSSLMTLPTRLVSNLP